MIEIEPLMGLRMIHDGSVCLISTRLEEKANVAVLTWRMPVSQNPPMLAVSLTPSSRTNHFLRATGEFVLSIPDASLIAETHFCGTHSGMEYDKIRLMELRTLRALKVSPLLIANCLGHLECTVKDWMPLGDRHFYIAKVEAALVEKDYFDQGWNDQAQTLHHIGGVYYRIGGGAVDATRFPLPMSQPMGSNPFADNRKDRFLEDFE